MESKKRREFFYDRAKNLLRWDCFHLIDEDWSGESLDIYDPQRSLPEICNMYVLNTSIPSDGIMEGIVCVECIVVYSDLEDVQYVTGTLLMLLEDERLAIVHNNYYREGLDDLISLLDNIQPSTGEDGRNMQKLLERIGEIAASEINLLEGQSGGV